MVSTPNSATDATRRDPFTPVEPEEESAATAEKVEQWRRYHAPVAGYPEWVMRRAVVAAARLDRDVAHEAVIGAYEANRARLSWDEDRRLAAEELGAKLHKDPAKIRRLLEETLQGAEWLIERWDALERIAESGRAWTAPQRTLALDLLGTPPALRDGPSAFDPRPASTYPTRKRPSPATSAPGSSGSASASSLPATRARRARRVGRLFERQPRHDPAPTERGVLVPRVSPRLFRVPPRLPPSRRIQDGPEPDLGLVSNSRPRRSPSSAPDSARN